MDSNGVAHHTRMLFWSYVDESVTNSYSYPHFADNLQQIFKLVNIRHTKMRAIIPLIVLHRNGL